MQQTRIFNPLRRWHHRIANADVNLYSQARGTHPRGQCHTVAAVGAIDANGLETQRVGKKSHRVRLNWHCADFGKDLDQGLGRYLAETKHVRIARWTESIPHPSEHQQRAFQSELLAVGADTGIARARSAQARDWDPHRCALRAAKALPAATGQAPRAASSSDQRFEIGAHHALNATYARIAMQLIEREATHPPALS